MPDESNAPKKHGGRRPGAGRRPKGSLAALTGMLPPSATPAKPLQNVTLRDLEGLALQTLKAIMESCPSDAPRVAAATLVLRCCREDAAAATTAVEGKKAARIAAAEEHMASGSRFAAPPPPGTLRQ